MFAYLVKTLNKFVATLLGVFFLASSAGATVVTFNDFSTTAGLTLSGNAAGNVNNGIDANPVLRLVPAAFGQSGSAFSSTTINSATFSTFFQFRITNPGGACDGIECGADGFTFTIQSISSSIGGGGGGLGYDGIGSSVAVEFDTWRNGNDPQGDSNHVGIDSNGSTTSLITTAVLPRFDNGNLWSAWIDYDGTTLDVRANMTGLRPAASLLSLAIDIPTITGTNNAFVGFTAGTGAAFGNHDIVNWEYRDTFNPIDVPEPLSLILIGAGLAGLGFGRRKKTC